MAIKHLNNKCGDLCGFAMHGNRDSGSEEASVSYLYLFIQELTLNCSIDYLKN